MCISSTSSSVVRSFSLPPPKSGSVKAPSPTRERLTRLPAALAAPRLRKMVEAAVLAVSLAGGIDEGEVARLVDVREQLVLGGKAELLERERDLLGARHGHEGC